MPEITSLTDAELSVLNRVYGQRINAAEEAAKERVVQITKLWQRTPRSGMHRPHGCRRGQPGLLQP